MSEQFNQVDPTSTQGGEGQGGDISQWSILTDDQVAQLKAQGQEQQQQFVDPTTQQIDTSTGNGGNNQEFSDDEIGSYVLEYISEKLGTQFSSFDDLTPKQQVALTEQLDDQVRAIADFVKETGRTASDWFAYQQLNPTEMDDVTAIKVKLSSDYPDLSYEDLDLLVQSKYKTNESMYDTDEVRLAKLQLKIDSAEARKSIEEIRERYKAPDRSNQEVENPFDQEWISTMELELDNLDGIEFSLGEGKSFTFGVDPRYKRELASKNANIENYFDTYVSDSGDWDFDKFNMHRTVIDNIDQIVASVYRQGISDGQRNVVNVAGNVSTKSPSYSDSMQQGPSKLSEQLRTALGGGSTLTFKL
jgi:hypothetical protein